MLSSTFLSVTVALPLFCIESIDQCMAGDAVLNNFPLINYFCVGHSYAHTTVLYVTPAAGGGAGVGVGAVFVQ